MSEPRTLQLNDNQRARFPLTAALLDYQEHPYSGRYLRFLAFRYREALRAGLHPFEGVGLDSVVFD